MADGHLLGDVLRTARDRLAATIEDPSQEVRILAEWAFGLSRLELVIRDQEPADPQKVANFQLALARREQGEPVYRIIGSRPFRSLDLALSEATLEPRPDTETLVDLALAHLAARSGSGLVPSILDLGTGTGAIGLALLCELPSATALLTDIAPDALKTAAKNASAHNLNGRATFLQSNWFDGITGAFDLIVSNPPYIASAAIASLDVEVRNHDPVAALDGGADGLDPYRTIAASAATHLTPSGLVAVEIGFDQAASVTGIFEAAGFQLLELRQDLGGRDRALAFAVR